MPDVRKEPPLDRQDRAWPQYSAAFMMALCLSMAWTAMPFVLSAMGGTNAHVGYAPAVNNLAYMIALFVAGSRLGHLAVKRTTLTAGMVAFAATATMGAAALLAGSHGGGRAWIWMLVLAGGGGGAAMAFYWPFLMSWVSADYEGVRLNRRLGRYNGAWSSGGVVGPLIGAWLFEVHPVLPLFGAAASVLLAQLLLSFGRHRPVHADVASRPAGANEIACDRRTLADCRWMSRIALFSACVCFAVVRSQFALVFRGLGFAESQFGVYLMIYALCNFLALVAAGRWAFWHFRSGLLIAAQALFLLMLVMTIYGRTRAVFFTAAVTLGLAYGFAYSSHLYYGASASRRRSARMAIHEMVISLGLTIGSAAGGYLSEHVGLYTPYWFATGVVGLGMIGQVAIHVGSRARADVAQPAPAAGDIGAAEP